MHRLWSLCPGLPGACHFRRTAPALSPDETVCIRCGLCLSSCRFDAIITVSEGLGAQSHGRHKAAGGNANTTTASGRGNKMTTVTLTIDGTKVTVKKEQLSWQQPKKQGSTSPIPAMTRGLSLSAPAVSALWRLKGRPSPLLPVPPKQPTGWWSDR